MFYDTGWQKLVQFIYLHYMTGVPYSIILDGDNMAYVWSSAYPGSENSVLNKLLNDCHRRAARRANLGAQGKRSSFLRKSPLTIVVACTKGPSHGSWTT